ncbi:MAG: toll/interleukin-1 receptor domain-containing protein [Chloroflexi bacterium]|nr:toll/interleukin-1 receptor domain-containing protein [Chloroflexota bacterium]
MTDDNIRQPEQRQIHLRVPRDKALQRIKPQIEEGENLLNTPIKNREQLNDAQYNVTIWISYTEELLRYLFDTEELAYRFSGFGAYIERPYTFQEAVADLRKKLREHLAQLDAIYKQVEQGLFLVKAPQPPPSQDEAGRKPRPMDRFASEMGQICGDKTEQVFISHATEDAQFAHRLADDLQRLGVQVWIAPESIRPGEGWVEAIERGLAESSHMVVVLTPAALESEWVRKETDVAIAQERKGLIQVIPLDVEPCEVSLLLGSYQMASFRRNYDAGLSQLVDILGVRITPSEPVRPPRQGPTNNEKHDQLPSPLHSKPSPPSSTVSLPKSKRLSSSC